MIMDGAEQGTELTLRSCVPLLQGSVYQGRWLGGLFVSNNADRRNQGRAIIPIRRGSQAIAVDRRQ